MRTAGAFPGPRQHPGHRQRAQSAIGLLRLISAQTKVQTLGDDLLAVDALIFVTCVFLAFWSFKTKVPRTRRRLRLAVDILFLAGLAGMAAICAVIAYAIF
jgi:hypothetical protein